MARVNVEDGLFKDYRFIELCMRLGGVDTALGSLVRAWILAQRWYLTPERMIPVQEWQKQRLPQEIVEVGLAEQVDGKIRLSGADKQFAWLNQKVEAGRRGGSIKKPRPRKQREKSEAGASGRLAQASAAKPPFSFLSSPSSGSTSGSGSTSPPGERDSSNRLPAGESTQEFIAHYVDQYRMAMGGVDPVIDGQAAGIAKRVVKAVGLPKAKALIEGYLAMKDQWFITKAYDLPTFASNLNKVSAYTATGQVTTREEARQAENDSYYENQLRRVREGRA